jgi:hypothetical protein
MQQKFYFQLWRCFHNHSYNYNVKSVWKVLNTFSLFGKMKMDFGTYMLIYMLYIKIFIKVNQQKKSADTEKTQPYVWSAQPVVAQRSPPNLTLQPPAHANSSLADFSTLKMEALRSSETSVHTRSTRRHIPEDGILHSQGIRLFILIKEIICNYWQNLLIRTHQEVGQWEKVKRRT